MFALIRSRLSYANVTATLALFIALGGGAYAAFKLPNNSVKSKHIVNGQVKSGDVKDDGLSGRDIREDTLGQVPSAEKLDDKEADDFALAGSEPWTPFILEDDTRYCRYVNFEGGFNPAGYFRDRAGVVHLRGLIKAVDGTQQSCGENPQTDGEINSTDPLPLGYRPEERELFLIATNNKPGRIDTYTGGVMNLETIANFPAWADAKAWVSLDGISFRCWPSGQDGCP